jgi:hypothetical protein
MKIRCGFVSNSSSSSFIVGKVEEDWEDDPQDPQQHPSDKQLLEIRELKKWGFIIGETNDFIFGTADMDNLGVREYFDKIGIPTHLYQINDHNDCGWVQRGFITSYIQKLKEEEYDLK